MFWEELKGKSSKLEQRSSELKSVQEQLEEARRLAKDAHAKKDNEKKVFQTERKGLLRDLERAWAKEVEAKRKIIDFEARLTRSSS